MADARQILKVDWELLPLVEDETLSSESTFQLREHFKADSHSKLSSISISSSGECTNDFAVPASQPNDTQVTPDMRKTREMSAPLSIEYV